jgi:hypothetical protein
MVLGFRVKFTLPRGTGVATSPPSDSLELAVDRAANLESGSKVTILVWPARTAMSFLIVRDTPVCYERSPVGSSRLSIAEEHCGVSLGAGSEVLSTRLLATQMIVGITHNRRASL